MGTDLASMLASADGYLPKERYISQAFADLEHERLWPRVWQIACREEEVAGPGDFVEYTIGEQSVLVVRDGEGRIVAHHNACLHRGTRLATGCGTFDRGDIRCRYHAWRYGLDGRLLEVVDQHEFAALPEGLCLPPVRAECWGGFVFVNLDPNAPPLLEYLDPLPALLGPYHLETMRFRAYQSTVLPANWKVVVDAFNEAYHVQGTHPQILPWTDDVAIAYEPLGIHSHYGRLAQARRELRPSPRLGLRDDEFDEGEILAGLVAGLGRLFLGEEMAIVDELRTEWKTRAPSDDRRLIVEYQKRRRDLLAARGLDVSGLALDQMTSADDVFVFPNVVGPLYPGSAIVFRMRPNGTDPHSSIKDTWTLEWPRPDAPARAWERRFYPQWQDKDWGEITNQDYANMLEVQTGMRSRGFAGSRLNPRQEANVLHMHRVLDGYLTD
jgi:phenylpropionate dioxygenase-like ring-hydroxylating dioxygenase large terminal subunit